MGGDGPFSTTALYPWTTKEGDHTPDRNPTALKNNVPPPSNRAFPAALKTRCYWTKPLCPPPLTRSSFLLLVYIGQNSQLVLQDRGRREVWYRSRILGPVERTTTIMLIMMMKKGCFYLFSQDYCVVSSGRLLYSGTHLRAHRRVMLWYWWCVVVVGLYVCSVPANHTLCMDHWIPCQFYTPTQVGAIFIPSFKKDG